MHLIRIKTPCYFNMLKPYFEKPPGMSGQKSSGLTAVLTKEKMLSSVDLPEDGTLSSAEVLICPLCSIVSERFVSLS